MTIYKLIFFSLLKNDLFIYNDANNNLMLPKPQINFYVSKYTIECFPEWGKHIGLGCF